MEAGLHGAQGDLQGVGDGLEIEAVDKPHQDDLLLDVAQPVEQSRGLIGGRRWRGGVDFRIERRLAAGQPGAR